MASLKILDFSMPPDDCPGITQTTCIEKLCVAALFIIPVCVVGGAYAAVSAILRHTDNYGPGAVVFLVSGSLFFLITSNRVSERRGYSALGLFYTVASLYSVCHHDAATIDIDEKLRLSYGLFLIPLALSLSVPLGIGLGKLFPKQIENSLPEA